MRPIFRLSLCTISLLGTFIISVHSQMITGVWKGKINRQKVEIKIIQQGDSLTGASYYYESGSRFRHYLIRGYFDAQTNEAVWWDDRLISEESDLRSAPGKMPLLSRADFNCPGSGKMMLDGNSMNPENENKKLGKCIWKKPKNPYSRMNGIMLYRTIPVAPVIPRSLIALRQLLCNRR